MRIFIDRIREFRGEPVYEILGKTREHHEFFVMYREWLSGKKLCRNLDYRQMAGYQAYGEPEKFQLATGWFKKTPGIVYRTPTPEDLEPVLKRFPDFKYIAKKKTDEMHLLSQLFLYPAEFLLTAGIFIGAIWANVSWGRYWGWDPKEVWALITMLIYAIPMHSTSITWMRKPSHYHWFMVGAFLAVLITYFGVNFFLGGLHSYAN